MQEEMATWLLSAGITILGKVFFEVGTGHKPVIPVCFFLMGAEKVITVDLNRRLDQKLFQGVLNHLHAKKDALITKWENFTPKDVLEERFKLLSRLKNDPVEFLQQSGIQYLPQTDAAATLLQDASIDCHLSNTVMEHIPPGTLAGIVKESYRLLKKNGVALHFVDLSDHFQHQDPSISIINFLRYSEQEWDRIAGNGYAYTNRLRVPEYLSIWNDASFIVLREERRQGSDESVLKNKNVLLDSSFSQYSWEEINTVVLKIMLAKS